MYKYLYSFLIYLIKIKSLIHITICLNSKKVIIISESDHHQLIMLASSQIYFFQWNYDSTTQRVFQFLLIQYFYTISSFFSSTNAINFVYCLLLYLLYLDSIYFFPSKHFGAFYPSSTGIVIRLL